MKKIILLTFIALFSFSCLKKTRKKSSSGGTTQVDTSTLQVRWNNVHLVSGITLKTSTDFINSFNPADIDDNGYHPIQQMMKEWNDATSVYNFFQLDADTTTNKEYSALGSYYDSEMGVYKHTGWFHDVSSSALAITQFFGLRRQVGTPSEYIEMVHADIIVNYRDYDFSTNADSVTEYDLPTVILHELGHFIGLAHTSNLSSNSIMLPYLSIFDSQRTINTFDQSFAQSHYQVSSLTASSRALKAQSARTSAATTYPDEGKLVRGVIELRSDGKCLHYINNKLVHQHSK